MAYCSVVTVPALVGLTNKRFGHFAILKILSLRSPIWKEKSHCFQMASKMLRHTEESAQRRRVFPFNFDKTKRI